jgi:hypothetical protein
MRRLESGGEDERQELAALQAGLVDAVLAPPGLEPAQLAPKGLKALPGIRGALPQALRAYRGHARALSERALTSIFPRLRERMEGRHPGSFAAIAWSCWRRHAPVEGDLGEWGQALTGLLAEAEADGLPPAWTALARLEWALHRAERVADPVQDLGSLALLGRLPAGAVRLVLADHVDLHRGDTAAMRELLALPPECFGAGPREAVIVWRDGWRGQWAALDGSVLRWCEALREGADLERALLDAGLAFDFSAWLPAAVARGWLARVETV